MTANTLPKGKLISWLGDDFTGSAAVLEVLAFAGISSVLFLKIPTPSQMERFKDVQALGLASTARAHGSEWMLRHLPQMFDWLAKQNTPISQYKICSTLDSAPEVGSIGTAIDIAAPMFRSKWIPFFTAAPAMQRYQAFGHLFAGSQHGVFRLDRHPIMARHPITPMKESDTCIHLSRQTARKLSLIDLVNLRDDELADTELAHQIENGSEIISIDAVSLTDEKKVGRLVWENRGDALFVVASQGLEYALISHWQHKGMIKKPEVQVSAGPVDQMIAVSGSVSDTTAEQINWAEANGFEPIALDVLGLISRNPIAQESVIEAALSALTAGRDPLLYTARGRNDPNFAIVQAEITEKDQDAESVNAAIGAGVGSILAELLNRTNIRRAVISGGDTSGHVVNQLGLFALTALAPTTAGAALMRAHSQTSQFDGLELALKGGQMGSENYFGWIRAGGGAPLAA